MLVWHGVACVCKEWRTHSMMFVCHCESQLREGITEPVQICAKGNLQCC